MNISTVKSELEGILHGTTVNKITNINGVFNRAARRLLLDLDPQETKRIVPLTTQIYNSVYDYACPSDLKGNKIIDIRPQVQRKTNDKYIQNYNREFDIQKNLSFQGLFTINIDSGVKTIRLNSPFLPQPVVINSADDPTSNGAWIDSGGITNITQDTVNYAFGASSLSFDIDNSLSPTIRNSTMAAIDLSALENQGTFFFWVYLPTASNMTQITFDIGSDAGNILRKAITTQHDGAVFQDGWNLLSADWADMQVFNSPDASAFSYIQLLFSNSTTAEAGVKLNGFQCILGKIMEIEYYSKCLFRNVNTGAFQETVLDDSDLINLDTETFNLFLNLAAMYAVQQSLGEDATYDTNFYMNEYEKGLRKYKAIYKSEIQLPSTTYYKVPNTSSTRYLGRRNNY